MKFGTGKPYKAATRPRPASYRPLRPAVIDHRPAKCVQCNRKIQNADWQVMQIDSGTGRAGFFLLCRLPLFIKFTVTGEDCFSEGWAVEVGAFRIIRTALFSGVKGERERGISRVVTDV